MIVVPLWCLSVGLVYISFLCSGPLYSCASGSPFINISLLLNFKARQSSGWQLTAPAADQRPVLLLCFLLSHHLCRPQRHCSRAARPGIPTSGHSPRLNRHRGQGVRQAEVKTKSVMQVRMRDSVTLDLISCLVGVSRC